MSNEELDRMFENRWRIKGYKHDDEPDIKSLCRDFFEAGVALSQPQIKTSVVVDKKSTNLFERSIPFNQSVFTTENENKYGKQMLCDFYEYWSEPNPSKTKMRFELQKTWDVNRRLARWARNNFNRYDRQQSTTEEHRSKLGDILAP